MADICIREAGCADKECWNRFVDENNGSFFQYYEWKIFYESQGHKAFFVLAENSNKDILGIFPYLCAFPAILGLLDADSKFSYQFPYCPRNLDLDL